MRFISKKVFELQNYIFLLLIFLLPTQLGKHFWPEWSLVNGIRVDYLSPTIYVTDILIVFLLLFNIFQKILSNTNQYYQILTNTTKLKKIVKNKSALCLLFFLLYTYLFICVFFPHFSPLSLIKFIKISEVLAFAYLVKVYVNKKTYKQFILVLSLSMLFQSGLAMAQFFNHGSINGIFYWFGERNFTASTPGIANASINGNLILRPYGTLPHPNVLAAYLLVGISIVSNFWRNVKKNEFTNLRIFVLIISSVALVLTLSRVAILLWGVFVILNFKFKSRARLLVYSFVFILVAVVMFPRFSSIFTEDRESLVKRYEQTKIAIAMIKDHPILGVGLNRYLVELPKYLKNAGYRDYQPVHNVFLLIIAETGLVGVLLTFFFIWRLGFSQITSRFSRIKKNKKDSYIRIFLYSSILILSLFDHYFWTTQQGNLMIGLVVGAFCYNLKYDKS